MHTIKATDLARNTRRILDMVANGGETVIVERNSAIIAQIVPPERTMTASQAIAGLRPVLSKEEASAWLQDSKNGFDETLRDPWE